MISGKLLLLIAIVLLRSVAVASVACMIGSLLAHLLRARRAQPVKLIWLLLPLIMPSLVVGYAYADFSLSLIHKPLLNELFYALLLTMRLSPLAAIVLLLAPRPISSMSLHTARLAAQMPRPMRYKLWMQGSGRALLITAAACFIFSFTEFDLASRMGVSAWVVWVFDAQAGGLPLSKTVVSVLLPIAIQLAVAFAALALLRKPQDHAQPTARQPIRCTIAWLWTIASFATVCVLPAVFVMRGAIGTLDDLLANGTIHKELLAGAAFSLTSGSIALLIAWAVRSRSKFLLLPFAAPGLAGSLVVGLLLLAAFQTAPLRPLYDTPIPLIVALVLVVLPIVLLLSVLLHRHWKMPADHVRKLLARSSDQQHRQTARKMWFASRSMPIAIVWLIACWLCYTELPASALLAPTGMTPAVVRLYNLMHYEGSNMLSAMVLVTYLIPLTLLIALLAIRRLFRGGLTAHA